MGKNNKSGLGKKLAWFVLGLALIAMYYGGGYNYSLKKSKEQYARVIQKADTSGNGEIETREAIKAYREAGFNNYKILSLMEHGAETDYLKKHFSQFGVAEEIRAIPVDTSSYEGRNFAVRLLADRDGDGFLSVGEVRDAFEDAYGGNKVGGLSLYTEKDLKQLVGRLFFCPWRMYKFPTIEKYLENESF
ncbi:hypothetical protein ES703_123244 [subsurface metagenome]